MYIAPISTSIFTWPPSFCMISSVTGFKAYLICNYFKGSSSKQGRVPGTHGLGVACFTLRHTISLAAEITSTSNNSKCPLYIARGNDSVLGAFQLLHSALDATAAALNLPLWLQTEENLKFYRLASQSQQLEPPAAYRHSYKLGSLPPVLPSVKLAETLLTAGLLPPSLPLLSL